MSSFLPDRYQIDPPPAQVEDSSDYVWKTWFQKVYRRFGSFAFGIAGTSKANLTAANGLHPAQWASNTSKISYTGLIYVYDEAGGPTLAFSDGTNWLRVQDRAIVS